MGQEETTKSKISFFNIKIINLMIYIICSQSKLF